jgi:crossover junction endodeoxyribonuclease RuvC
MICIGIDQGHEGGIVAIDADRRVVLARRMPTLPKGKSGKRLDFTGLWEALEMLMAARPPGTVYAIIERSQAMPAQGATSAWTMGLQQGAIQMAMRALSIPYEIVHPSKWQRKILGATSGKAKGRAIETVGRLLPELDLRPGQCRKPHDGLADAGCMALYARERIK